MCEFNQVTAVALHGSGKSTQGWFALDDAQVYHDHFIRANFAEGIVIDVLAPAGRGVNVCLELSAVSARELAEAILATVDGLEAKQAETAARLAVTASAGAPA